MQTPDEFIDEEMWERLEGYDTVLRDEKGLINAFQVRDAELKASAWDEGFIAGVRYRSGLEPPGPFAINPYQKDLDADSGESGKDS